ARPPRGREGVMAPVAQPAIPSPRVPPPGASAPRAAARSALPVVVGVVAATLLQLAVPTGTYTEKILFDIGVNVILAVSLNLVNGFTGQFSIGHAGFMAVGAYAS